MTGTRDKQAENRDVPPKTGRVATLGGREGKGGGSEGSVPLFDIAEVATLMAAVETSVFVHFQDDGQKRK